MYFPVSEWFAAFLLTLAIELPLAGVLLRPAEPDLRRLVVLVVFANLATHLVVWYVISQFLLVGTAPYVVVAEAWAVAAEAVFYAAAFRGLPVSRALGIAVLANAASFLVGRLVAQPLIELFR